jgi:microcystin-dependent protein
MAQPYVGEIRMFAGNFPPAGWAFCQGQQLPISENETLFQLIGTTYGGDGQETFNLPDLRGRVPIHQSNSNLAEMGGVEEVTLTMQQIPIHSHALLARQGAGNQGSPIGNYVAESPGNIFPFIQDVPSTAMGNQAVAPVGGSQPHTNFQPYLCLNFILSLFGIFPSPS